MATGVGPYRVEFKDGGDEWVKPCGCRASDAPDAEVLQNGAVVAYVCQSCGKVQEQPVKVEFKYYRRRWARVADLDVEKIIRETIQRRIREMERRGFSQPADRIRAELLRSMLRNRRSPNGEEKEDDRE